TSKSHTVLTSLTFTMNECQKKADEFMSNCLEPALEKYMSEIMGMKMADKM
ncbi:hypothetical protein M9458_021429, partial [Cirrhinus mrigala]